MSNDPQSPQIEPEATQEQRPLEKPKKSRRGFASMDPTKVRELARAGGVAAHRAGTAHRFTSEEARSAGKKGGAAPHRTRGRSQPIEEEASVPST